MTASVSAVRRELSCNFFDSMPYVLLDSYTGLHRRAKRRPPRDSRGNSAQKWWGGGHFKKILNFFMHKALQIILKFSLGPGQFYFQNCPTGQTRLYLKDHFIGKEKICVQANSNCNFIAKKDP